MEKDFNSLLGDHDTPGSRNNMDMSEEVGKLVACAGNRLEARTHPRAQWVTGLQRQTES